jgi:hypothetical protein
MASLFNAQQVSGLEAALSAVHDTYALPYVWYKTPQMTIIDSNMNYKFSYGIQPEGVGENDYVSYNIQSGIFSGVIQYADTLDKLFSNPQGSRGENFRITMDAGWVRLKVRKEDFDNFLKDTQTLMFDDRQFTIFRTERPHGIFAPKYYTLYLQYQN